MSKLSTLYYWLCNALRGMRSGMLIQLASTTSIALSLLLVGLVGMGLLNLNRLTQHWGEGVQVIAYVKHAADVQRVEALGRMLEQRQEVQSVRWVSPAEAHKRLSGSLGTHGNALAAVEEDFLPGSLEIRLSKDQPQRARTLIALLNASSLVDEVDYMGDWARRLSSLVTLINLLALGLTLAVCLACLYIVSSTIRLGVHARREEIAILKLVGATDGFIRAPFMIEGTIQGMAGAVLACILLYIIYASGAPRIEGLLTAAFSHVELAFVPLRHLLLGVVTAGALGLLGSRLALGRYLEV